MKEHCQSSLITSFFLFIVFANKLLAQSPQYYYTPNLVTANAFPMGSGTGDTRQNLYYPSDFNAPSGMVSKIYIKAAAATNAPTYSPLTLKVAPSTLTVFTAGPFISGLTTVYSANVTVAANSALWLEFPLQTPFYYDNTQNLIIEVARGTVTNGYSAPCASNSAVPSTVNRTLQGPALSGVGALQARLMPIGFDITPLSVHLISFSARISGRNNLLEWRVADEVNMNKYVVEYGQDGKLFETKGEVAAKSALGISEYQFLDMNENQKGNVAYYRLRMIENDGTSNYSNVISLQFKNTSNKVPFISPNPFNNYLQVQLNPDKPGKMKLTIIDLVGRVSFFTSIDIQSGPQIIALNGLSELHDGIYQLNITLNENSWFERVQKSN
jgi:hypothetical protein